MVAPFSNLIASRFLPNPSERRDLSSRFQGCPQEILSEAFQTPSALPAFHARLIDSYASVPARGDAFFTAVAVKNAFRFNALTSPRGSFQNAVLQMHVAAAVFDPDRTQGRSQLAGLFERMIDGWSEGDAHSVFAGSPYANFLDEPCFESVRRRHRHDGRKIARYLGDSRLSGHWDGVSRETSRLRADPEGLRAIRRRLEKAVLDFFASGRDPDALLLADLARAVGTYQARELLCDWMDFNIVFTEGAAINRLAARSGLSGKADAFFVPPENGQTKGTFLLRSFPRFETRTEEGRNAAFAEIVNRLIDLFHEWRHGRDALKEGIFTNWGRHDRIVFEVRALLEEHLFRVTIGEENFERTARRMGDPLIEFLIHFADWLYP